MRRAPCPSVLTRGLLAAALGLGLIGATPASADEILHRPLSPSFGGDPMNTTFLLQSAQIQNLMTPKAPKVTPLTPQQQLLESIRTRVYSRLSATVSDAIFGENAKERGTIDLGGESIGYERVGSNIVLSLIENGKATTITFPVTSIAP
jgi:curli production assembly/transport component CsgF